MTAARWQRRELAYCSNVHAGEALAEVESQVLPAVAAVRELRGLEHIASGLWLSAAAAHELAGSPARLRQFSAACARNGIELVTLNGFPYGDFHTERVKEQVYQPDWSDPRRRQYTLALAEVLAALSSAALAEATISTLPLGDASGWTRARHAGALDALIDTAQSLRAIERRTGRSVRVCLEMEPGCVLERTAQTLSLFGDELPARARAAGVDTALVQRHLGVCLDVCHQAVMFEDVAASMRALHSAGICVGKIQISSALEIAEPASARDALAAFAEPRYLHQVRTRGSDGAPLGTPDLDAALVPGTLPAQQPWRVHFHVPVQAAALCTGLGTTRAAIEQVLDELAATPALRPQLEVETYTWEVLPREHRPADRRALIASIGHELDWLEAALRERALMGPA